MTDFNIEIIQQPSYSLDVTTGTSGVDSPTVEVVTSGGVYLEVSNRDKILPSDFPDTYPISSTTGLLPISRVSGLYSGSGIVFSSGLDGSLTINALAQNITLSGTSGISVSQSGNLYTIYTTGTFGLSSSQIQSLLNSGVSINVISGTGNFNSLSISGTPVSVSGHSHIASSITDFNSSVSGLLPVKNILGSGYASVASSGGVFTVSVTGLQPSGNYSSSGHQHIASDITNFNSSVSGLFPITNIVGISGASVTSSGTTFTVAVTGSFGLTTSQIQSLLNSGVSISVTGGTGNFNSLSVNSVPVSTSGHSHLSSSITDFNTSVNNLISVKNVSGSGYVNVLATTGNYIISVSGLQPSGNYSVSGHSHTVSDIVDFASGVSGVSTIKGLVAGYDVSISGTSGIYTISSTNLVHVDSQQPQGFVNRTDSRISVSGNVFRIEPTGSSYSYYNKGVKVVKTSGDILTIPNLTQINYIHFDTVNNQISNKTTGFDFNTDIPIAYISWNSGVGPSGQMSFFAEERHGIVMDTSTHKWIHNTFGAQYIDGLSIGSYVLGGDGSSNTHATISIGNGTLYQEDIEINITDSSSADPFCQELSPIAQIPVYYHEGSTGQWVKNTATNYPVKYGANGPQYNLLTAGNWTTPDVSPGGQTRYFAVWILATNQIDDPIVSIMGQRIDSNQGSAESNNSWSDINLTNLPLSELKPLYRLIFAGDSDYTNDPKCTLLSILDIRVAVISTIAGISQNDHGSLFGLGDDDHSQYIHIDNVRTINAIHTFQNGITFDGNGTQTVAYLPGSVAISGGSGNFSTLQVGGTNVSISGHSHTLTIGSGSGIAITYDSSQTLNIIGSGNSEVSYNNSNKTVLISSPTANRGYEVLGSGKSVFAVDNGYAVGNIDVFYNGVKLLNGSDFTATNGTTFALAVSGIAGDVVEWACFTASPRYQVVMGEVRSDFVSGVNYIGNALQGSSESDSVWRIKKTTISSDGAILSNLTATNVRWTDRLIETYV